METGGALSLLTAPTGVEPESAVTAGKGVGVTGTEGAIDVTAVGTRD